VAIIPMRQRKRADWLIIVYQYWVRMEHDSWESLPQAVQTEAEAMRMLWNELVDLFTQRLVTPIASRSPHKVFQAEMRGLAAQSSAAWANKQFVMTQFQAALTRFFKAQSAPPRHKIGPPERLHFHHRFTGGGIPIERLFGRGQRLHLEPLAAAASLSTLSPRQYKRLSHTTGSFQIGDSHLDFHTIIHRPFPPLAYLKAATLVGQQTTKSGYRCNAAGAHILPARWRWSLHLTLEVPQYAAPRPSRADLTAAINIDCQQVSETNLRIAVLTDMNGREEEIEFPPVIIQKWRHKRSLQRSAEHLLNEIKSQLRELRHSAQCPPTVRHALAHLESMQAPGLWRLLDSLQTHDPEGVALKLVRRWADRSTRLLREARGLERHYLRHRDWFYRNTALHLCQRYQHLLLTTQDSSTALKENAQSAPSQQQAAFRQLAAPAHFIAFLQQAAKKTQTEVNFKNN
jgi:hypothetical protein